MARGTAWQVLPVLVVPLVVVGLLVKENGSRGFDDIGWSVLAVAAAVLQLATVARSAVGLDERRAWTWAAVGVGALGVHWLLLVLPGISGETGFVLTVAFACACGGLWLAPGRPR